MNEEQKQTVADLKIKIANGASQSYVQHRLRSITPQAADEVQNGCCDVVAPITYDEACSGVGR